MSKGLCLLAMQVEYKDTDESTDEELGEKDIPCKGKA